MSMLLGVRNSARENEGQPIREGIIQQPASFYNGNPSSSIWGNPPTPPLWRETSTVNGSSSSSSTSLASAPSFPSVPTTSTNSAGGMEQPPQQRNWQPHVFKAHRKQSFDAHGSNEGEVARGSERGKSYMSQPEPSVVKPMISPFSFGFPPQSTFSVFDRGRSEAFDLSDFPTDGSVEDKGSSRKLPEHDDRYLSADFVRLNTESKNQKSSSDRGPVRTDEGSRHNLGMPFMDNPMKGDESQLQFRNEESSNLCPPEAAQLPSAFTFPSMSSSQEPVSPEGLWKPVFKSSGTRMDHLVSSGEARKGAGVTTNEPQPPLGQKGEGVFVFGAAGISDTGLRNASSQPKFVTSSIPGAASRSRNAKFRKQNSQNKGKGPVGLAVGQVGSKMKDLSLKSSGPGSPAEKSWDESAECSGFLDTEVQPTDVPDLESGKSDFKFEFGADRSVVQSSEHVVQPSGIFWDKYQSIHEPYQGVHKPEMNEIKQVDWIQKTRETFHDWYPFTKVNDKGSRLNEQGKTELYKSDKNDNWRSKHTTKISEDLDGFSPFSRGDEVSIKGKDKIGQTSKKGKSKSGELAEDVISEENIANVIAGIANLQGLGNKEEKVRGVVADARVDKSKGWSETVSNKQAKRFPNHGEAGVKDPTLSDGWNFVPKSFVQQERTTSSSVDADATVNSSMAGPAAASSSEAKLLPKRGELGAKALKSSDLWKVFPNSSVPPLVAAEQVKEEPKLESVLEEFQRLGRFERSVGEQKENQESASNFSSNIGEEPFVFRASRPISKSASSLRAERANGKYSADDVSGVPLSNEKIEKLKTDDGNKAEDCPTRIVEEGLAGNDMQRSSWLASTHLSSCNGRENIGLVADNLAQKKQSSTPFQPNKFSSGSFVGMPIAGSLAGTSSFDALKQSPSVEVRGTTPIGEFSGPVSSPDSSASERSPTRDDQWPGGDLSSNQSYSFEFRGSNKEMRAGLAPRKKKAQRLVPNSRRNCKQTLNKAHRNPVMAPSEGGFSTFSKPTDEEASPMDFSPGFGIDTEVPVGSSTNNAGLEQPSFMGLYSPHSVEVEEDCREEWEHAVEDPRIEELRAAAAKIVIGNGHWDDTSKAEHQEFNGLFRQPKESVGVDTSCKRRSAFEEEQNTFSGLEAPWINNQVKRETEIAADLYSQSILSDEGSGQYKGFVFASSSPATVSSSMPRRRTRRIQRDRASGMMVDPVKQPILNREGDAQSVPAETGAYGRPDSACVSQGLMADSEGISHGLLGTFEPKAESRVSKAAVGARSSRPFSYDHDAERKGFTKKSDLESSLPGQRPDSGTSQSPSAVKSAAAEQVCERWRLRGNQAYANGDFPKAEEYYSRGASSVSPNETSQSCIRASMLCYSNRAATRMAVGRMREALADCMRAIVVDPNFLRVRLRAASCHIALGESKAAANMFKESLKLAKENSKLDPKITAEATEGIKKAQQLDDYADRASELLENGNTADSTAALRLLNEALLISPYSESLLEMKAEALFSLRRHDEVVQLCEQTLPSAERNHGSAANDQQHPDNYFVEPAVGGGNVFLKLWRWRMSAKSLYHLGSLDESLTLLLKHEEALSAIPSDKLGGADSLATVVCIIRDLSRHKAAGNEAFQAGKHAEAVEHYTAALACSGESRPYNAVCFCNRAAASQALGNVADAIADCSRAIALDPNYPKAISRRATLHEMVRDYGQACNDLRRLIAFLESYPQLGKNNLSSRAGGLSSNAQDLTQNRDRLIKAEDELKKGHPVDHYMILGVDVSWSANEIKKAYRKAALKHHPDKAGQFLTRGENGDDGSLWKEVGDEVRRDAERLFKMIGEAYAILSDPAKRLRYDTEEELRKLRVKNGPSSVSNTSEAYRSQYEKGGRRQRDRWDPWNGSQYQRWQSGPDAAQPDTYARRNNYASSGPKSSGDGGRNTDFDWDDV